VAALVEQAGQLALLHNTRQAETLGAGADPNARLLAPADVIVLH
jgi:hypothetical protein